MRKKGKRLFYRAQKVGQKEYLNALPLTRELTPKKPCNEFKWYKFRGPFKYYITGAQGGFELALRCVTRGTRGVKPSVTEHIRTGV